MKLDGYVDGVEDEFLRAARAFGDEAGKLAEILVAPLTSAFRLSLLRALSDAAAEITDELMPGTVEVRLRGLDPTFVVTAPPMSDPDLDGPDAVRSRPGGCGTEAGPGGAGADADGGAGADADSGAGAGADGGAEGTTVRVAFRPPARLKTQIDEAASREGISINAWLVRAVADVIGGDRRVARRSSSGIQRFTGWVR